MKRTLQEGLGWDVLAELEGSTPFLRRAGHGCPPRSHLRAQISLETVAGGLSPCKRVRRPDWPGSLWVLFGKVGPYTRTNLLSETSPLLDSEKLLPYWAPKDSPGTGVSVHRTNSLDSTYLPLWGPLLLLRCTSVSSSDLTTPVFGPTDLGSLRSSPPLGGVWRPPSSGVLWNRGPKVGGRGSRARRQSPWARHHWTISSGILWFVWVISY